MILVKLPLWKAYLYSLMERIRIFRAINIQTYNFGFNYDDRFLLRSMFKKYTQKGGHYKTLKDIRSIRYLNLINSVRANQVIATQEELEVVNRLSVVKHLNVEDLMKFEIAQLKTLAKEVGINALAAAKMKPEDLAKEIIKAVDPKKGYSTEFVKWYDAIPDDFLSTISATANDEAGSDHSELIEAINACTKMGELKEILNDKEIGAIFAKFNSSSYKLAGPCKKAMLEFLESKTEESGETGSEDNSAIATEIMAATSDDELVAVIEEHNALFTEFNPGDVTDLEEMKKLCVAHIGVELEKPEPKKESLKDKLKKKKEAEAAVTSGAESMVVDFNPNAGQFDPEGIYEMADGLGIGQLKKFYSQISKITQIEMASNKPGISKDALMEGLADALTDLAANGPKSGTCDCPAEGASETGEIEITKKLIDDAAKSEDKEALVAMCEKMGIALNALEKRNVARMKDKLIEKLPKEEATPKASGKLALLKSKGAAAVKEDPSEIAETSKLVEIFTIVEKMVLAESEEKDILAAVTPLYKEMGKSALAIRGRVKILIEVVQVDHNLKK